MRRTIKINLYANKGVHNKTMMTKMMMMILTLKVKLSAKNNTGKNDDHNDYN